MKLRVLMLAVLAGVSACATDVARRPAPPPSKYAAYLGPVVEDFHVFHFDSWEAVGRSELVIWTGMREAYLVKVWETCPDLNFANHIGLSSSFHRVTKFDKVRVEHQSCPISEIRSIDVARMKSDQAKAKAAAQEKAAAQTTT